MMTKDEAKAIELVLQMALNAQFVTPATYRGLREIVERETVTDGHSMLGTPPMRLRQDQLGVAMWGDHETHRLLQVLIDKLDQPKEEIK